LPNSTFLARNLRLLSFGFLLAFTSSFGQTFFISLFGDEMRSTFGLSHGDLGSIYAVATLCSGACLVWAGRRIDDVDLRLYTVLACSMLAAACLVTAWTPSVAILGLAFFCLRFGGQGLLSHTSGVTMARYFGADRGKAIGIGSLGYPAGEIVMPVLGVAAIATFGWRSVWLLAAACVIAMVPVLLWLLRGHAERHRRLLEQEAARPANQAAVDARIGVLYLLRHRPFIWRIPAVLMSPCLVTALIFHQAHIADLKGWSLAWMATTFIAYAVTKAMAALISGPIVDRLTAARALPFFILPLGLSPILLALIDHPLGAIAYFAVMGVSGGAASTAASAIWAEIYGPSRLGSVRAVASALSVLASGLGPPIFGLMFDAGLGIAAVAMVSAVAVLLTTALARAA
jgi:MFS family permease